MAKQYVIVADYHQFYLWDHGRNPQAPTDYQAEDVAHRIKTAPFVLVVQPARDMDVPVELDVIDSPPEDQFDDWDHVAEASLDLPSGQLEIHECTGGSVDILQVMPGTYRVRAYFGGMNTVSDDGLDGEDHYRLVLWPAPPSPIVVLKQHNDLI